MQLTIEQYASRNELNEKIARNMIHVTKLEDANESFEAIARFCFTRAYQICKHMIENSPVSIYHVPAYFKLAKYPYIEDEDQVNVIKAVTLSIVHILANHFEEEWKEANTELLDTIRIRMWKMELTSDKKMDKLASPIDRFIGRTRGCVQIFENMYLGTKIDYIVPFEEFNPKQLKTKKEDDKEIQGENVSSDVLQELEKVKAHNEELKAEIQRCKDELDAYKARQVNRGGINQLQTAHLGIKLAPKLGIVVNNKKDLAPALSKLFGWGQRKLEQEMSKYLPEEEEIALADIFGEISPELAKEICSKWKPDQNSQSEAPLIENEAPHTQNEAPLDE